MRWVYRSLLRLYPEKYRQLFAEEMQATFEQAASDSGRKGRRAYAWFAVFELIGLARGALGEWTATLSAVETYLAGCSSEMDIAGAGSDVRDLQRRVQILIGRMEWAIANHDFPRARLYCEQERVAREELKRILRDPGVTLPNFR